jgi:GGDEF domain-containing protein
VTISVESDRARVQDGDPPQSPATTLGGRAQLIDDLAEALRPGSPDVLFAIVFFEGFAGKTRRHGDRQRRRALTARCATLARALGPTGTCYRLREAEFAALIHARVDQANRLLAEALAQIEGDESENRGALAFGACVLPREAGEPVEALGLAGERLNHSRRGREARASDAIGPARTAKAG